MKRRSFLGSCAAAVFAPMIAARLSYAPMEIPRGPQADDELMGLKARMPDPHPVFAMRDGATYTPRIPKAPPELYGDQGAE